jgi:hypothetical protein
MLDPDKIYRETDAKELFGISRKYLKEKVKSGDIPAPHLLSPPPSRAKGWYGHVIIAYRERVAAEQAAWAAENAKHVPKGGNVKETNPPAKPKVKKVKLIPPRKAKG